MSRPSTPAAPRKRTPEHRVMLQRRAARRAADTRAFRQAARRLVSWSAAR